MRVTACIVSWNTAEHIPGVLATLDAQTHPDLDVVVVDNASADGSADLARRHGGVRVIANDRNLGFAGAANQGLAVAASAGGDAAMLLMNPDIRLAPDHVASLVASLRSDSRAATAQGRLWLMADAADGGMEGVALQREGRRVIDTTGHTAHTNRVFRNRGTGQLDDGRFDTPGEVFGVSGCAALYRVGALDDIAIDGEVFDEAMFAFFEDIDVDWRLRARGWTARYAPDATGVHERGGEGTRRSAVVERLSFRNWFLTVAKNDDPATAVRHAHLLGATTFLRTLDIALTAPSAFLRASTDLPPMLADAVRKRHRTDARRTVANRDIVEQWFGDFDYVDWFDRRIRRSRPARALGLDPVRGARQAAAGHRSADRPGRRRMP